MKNRVHAYLAEENERIGVTDLFGQAGREWLATSKGVEIWVAAPRPPEVSLKSISTRLRSRRDCSKAGVPANDLARSRASSSISRGILRCGVLGQHRDLSGHGSQSSLLARYNRVRPS